MVAATSEQLTNLLIDLARLGIRLEAHGDRLRYHPRSALTPDLAEQLRTHKAELLAVLGPTVRPEAAKLGVGPTALLQWEDYIEPPPVCPECGGLTFWWNVLGDRLCMKCNPPTVAAKTLERAERIRRRHGIPSPTGAAKTLADLRQIIDS